MILLLRRARRQRIRRLRKGEIFAGDAQFDCRRLAGNINLLLILFDLLQNLCLEILLSAKCAFHAWNVIDEQQIVIVPVQILYRSMFEFRISAKMADFHDDFLRS